MKCSQYNKIHNNSAHSVQKNPMNSKSLITVTQIEIKFLIMITFHIKMLVKEKNHKSKKKKKGLSIKSINFNVIAHRIDPHSSVVYCLISNSWRGFGGVLLGMDPLQVNRQQNHHLDFLRQDILETVHLIVCLSIRGNLKQLEDTEKQSL